MKKLIVNEQGEQYIDLTPAEITQREQDYLKSEQERIAYEQKISQELANKQSALTKLSALGLTEAEIKSIIG